MKTSETCIELVNANGQNLKHVPDRLKTFEVCKTAVKNNRLAVEFVPDSCKNLEICGLAVKKNKSNLWLFVPCEMSKTQDLYDHLIQIEAISLSDVPDEFKLPICAT